MHLRPDLLLFFFESGDTKKQRSQSNNKSPHDNDKSASERTLIGFAVRRLRSKNPTNVLNCINCTPFHPSPCPWSLVPGPWSLSLSLVPGPWSLVPVPGPCPLSLVPDDQWSLIGNHWAVIIDQWSVSNDQWSLINDQWSLINDQRWKSDKIDFRQKKKKTKKTGLKNHFSWASVLRRQEWWYSFCSKVG